MKLIATTGYNKVALLGTGDFFAYFLTTDVFLLRRDCCENMEDSDNWEEKCGEKVTYFIPENYPYILCFRQELAMY